MILYTYNTDMNILIYVQIYLYTYVYYIISYPVSFKDIPLDPSRWPCHALDATRRRSRRPRVPRRTGYDGSHQRKNTCFSRIIGFYTIDSQDIHGFSIDSILQILYYSFSREEQIEQRDVPWLLVTLLTIDDIDVFQGLQDSILQIRQNSGMCHGCWSHYLLQMIQMFFKDYRILYYRFIGYPWIFNRFYTIDSILQFFKRRIDRIAGCSMVVGHITYYR